MMKINAKPINFKLGEYINQGYNLLKNNFGNIFGAFLLCMLMSIIPFCGPVAAGNFYKYLRKLNKGQAASASEIFNFDDFMPYFMLQLIIIGAVFAIYIPIFIVMMVTSGGDPENASSIIPIFMVPYVLCIYAAILYFALKGFYMSALISLKGVKDLNSLECLKNND